MKKYIGSLLVILGATQVWASTTPQRQAVCVCQENANLPFGVPTFSLPAVGVGVNDDEAFDRAVIDCNRSMGENRLGKRALDGGRVALQILAGNIDRDYCTFSDVKVPEAK